MLKIHVFGGIGISEAEWSWWFLLEVNVFGGCDFRGTTEVGEGGIGRKFDFFLSTFLIIRLLLEKSRKI